MNLLCVVVVVVDVVVDDVVDVVVGGSKKSLYNNCPISVVILITNQTICIFYAIMSLFFVITMQILQIVHINQV